MLPAELYAFYSRQLISIILFRKHSIINLASDKVVYNCLHEVTNNCYEFLQRHPLPRRPILSQPRNLLKLSPNPESFIQPVCNLLTLSCYRVDPSETIFISCVLIVRLNAYQLTVLTWKKTRKRTGLSAPLDSCTRSIPAQIHEFSTTLEPQTRGVGCKVMDPNWRLAPDTQPTLMSWGHSY